jgi:aminoglycoside phosphotransferase (APT) family kinase protein
VSAIVACAADPGIASLAAVLDPVELRRILDELRPSCDAGLQDFEVRLLRHHPGKRCVFEIVEGAGSSRAWIGKVFAAERADIYQTMVAIRRDGFGAEAEFSIPEPIAYLPELRLLLQEKVIGAAATELFLSPHEAERERMAERCAAWLARLHTLALIAGPSFDLVQYQLSIQRWSDRIAGVGGALADRAGELRTRLERALPRIRNIGMRTCHGSFTHHQVIAAHGRTVTFDWDDHVLADPAYDVARFVVGLRRLALRSLASIRSLDAAVEVFLKIYQSRSRSDVTANLLFYAAAICLRLAKKDVTHQAAQWTEKAEATLDEGLRVLEQGI